MARAILHGANIKKFLKNPYEFSEKEISKLREDLLHRAFNQISKGEIRRESMCPTEYVKNELNKIKIEKTEMINDQIKK